MDNKYVNNISELNDEPQFEVCSCCGKIDYDFHNIQQFHNACECGCSCGEYMCSDCLNSIPSYIVKRKRDSRKAFQIDNEEIQY